MNSFENIPISDIQLYQHSINKLFEAAEVNISTISPSEWAVKNRIMRSNSGVPGRFSWENAPYTREITDCASQNHPARRIAVMKGVQIGMSTSMIQNVLGYMMAEDQNNMMLLVGHEDLIKDSTERIDAMISDSGIKLNPSVLKSKNNKSGDTEKKKEFTGGSLIIGISNHKTLRQVSIQTMIVDDYDGMKGSTKEAGSTEKMIEARTTAFAKKKKIFFVSTPELKQTSNIEPVYLKGDQRRYHIPCPCCNELIILEWDIQSEKFPSKTVGITWETETDGSLIADSVGYVCQKCDNFFDDSGKSEWLLEEGYGGHAKWIPTAKPIDPEYYSYQISALYSPIYMDGWVKYVRDFIDANPFNGKRKEKLHQTFVNLGLGITYEPRGISIDSEKLQKNTRPYEIGIIPEKLSIADGNGKIVMLTLGADLGGWDDSHPKWEIDDARLDWEIVAYAESGATYSIDHGSIGTFINRDKNRNQRELWSYKFGVERSVWPVLEKILTTQYLNDNTGKTLPIFMSGIDSGYMGKYVFKFMSISNAKSIVALKGKDIDKFQNKDADLKTFKPSKERRDLYLVETNHTKDLLSEDMELTWSEDIHDSQPLGFMNFPSPSDGKYSHKNYFSHFEAEHKIVDERGWFVWKKKTDKHQNHIYDCHLYALVVRDILLDKLFKEWKVKNGTWSDYVFAITK